MPLYQVTRLWACSVEGAAAVGGLVQRRHRVLVRSRVVQGQGRVLRSKNQVFLVSHEKALLLVALERVGEVRRRGRTSQPASLQDPRISMDFWISIDHAYPRIPKILFGLKWVAIRLGDF